MSDTDGAWICPKCAHFIVRPAESTHPPVHRCNPEVGEVEFIPYVDSDHALRIRNDIDGSSRPTTAPRTIR